MNIRHFVVITIFSIATSTLYSMHDQRNTTIQNTQTKIKHIDIKSINNTKNSLIESVKELRESLNNEKSEMKSNTLNSSMLLFGGMTSLAIGSTYGNLSLTFLGLAQLLGSAAIKSLMSERMSDFFSKHNTIYNNLEESIKTLPDEENQLEDNN